MWGLIESKRTKRVLKWLNLWKEGWEVLESRHCPHVWLKLTNKNGRVINTGILTGKLTG